METAKCTVMKPNKMQCTREAAFFKDNDPQNKYAMCSVCHALAGNPEGYQFKLESK